MKKPRTTDSQFTRGGANLHRVSRLITRVPWHRTVVPTVAVISFATMLGIAQAQTTDPRDEIFGGYSWLAPNGWGDLDYKINNIPNAFDISNTYYLRRAHNFGLLVDGSGHYLGSTTPPNLINGSADSTGVGYALAGLQYKLRRDGLSPFFRGFLGAANLSPDWSGVSRLAAVVVWITNSIGVFPSALCKSITFTPITAIYFRVLLRRRRTNSIPHACRPLLVRIRRSGTACVWPLELFSISMLAPAKTCREVRHLLRHLPGSKR